MPYYEVSARTGENVESMFLFLVDLINEELNKHRQRNEEKVDEGDADLPPLTKEPLKLAENRAVAMDENKSRCC